MDRRIEQFRKSTICYGRAFKFHSKMVSLSLTINMSGSGRIDTIKLFKTTQKAYHDIGILPPKSNQNRSVINSKNWFIIFSHAQFFITSAAYLMFEANSIIEFEMVSFTCSSILASFTLCRSYFGK